MTEWKPADFEVITHYEFGIMIVRSDGANIPPDPGNRDYQAFLQVEKEDLKGEIKRTTIPKPDPVPSLDDRVKALETDVAILKTKVGTSIVKSRSGK